MIPILIQWNLTDPVDVQESTRNQEIFDFQSNRNPFVDHPEFVNAIWNPTSVEDPFASPVPDFIVSAVYPNPFTSNAVFSIEAKEHENLVVRIFNIKGQMVRDEEFVAKAGKQEFSWDGKNAAGQELSAGIYIIRINSDKYSSTAKLIKG